MHMRGGWRCNDEGCRVEFAVPNSVTNICPVCKGAMAWDDNAEPALNWKFLVDRIIEENKAEVAAVEEALESKGPEKKKAEPLADGEYRVATPLPIPDAEADVIEYSDQLWVSHNVLLEAGYRWLESFDVVLINGTYYELQGHVGKGNRRFPGGAWWIEEVDENAEVDVPVLENEGP